jgi:hypothetical protein
MSTPTATLPIKTDNITEHSDINDPIVQDVLNEFRDELSSSKKKDEYTHSHTNMPQHSQQHSQPPLYSQPQHSPQQYQAPPQSQQSQLYQQPPHQPNYHNQYSRQNQTYNDSFPYFNIDFDIIKKNLIIVIIALLVYNTGLINMLYEKAPEYLQDNILPFDIYIRSATYFVVLYILSILEYL